MNHEIVTTFTVDATPQQVWDVLTDFETYHEWNPFITSVTGEADVGSRLDAHIALPGKNPRRFTPTVIRSQEAQSFAWLGQFGFRGLFDGEHRWELEATGDGRTTVIHAERFSGILVRPILAMTADDTRVGFETMNRAMQQRIATNVA